MPTPMKTSLVSQPLPFKGIPGVDAIWEFDDWIANERVYPDMWRVDEVGGIDDGELRDHREVNPDDVGETAFDAFAGGRTLTFTGQLCAGNIGLLRSYWSQMSAAMADLTERRLYIRTGTPGIYDAMQYDTRMLYTFVLGGNTVLFGESNFAPSDLSEKLYYYTWRDRRYTDVDVIVEYLIGGTSAGLRIRSILSYVDQNNYLAAELSGTAFSIVSVNSGVTTVLAVQPFAPVQTTYFVRGRLKGSTVWCEVWTTPPHDLLADKLSITATLTGSDLTKFGGSTQDYVGVDWIPASTTDRVNTFMVRPQNPNDMYFMCRKGASVQMKETQDSDYARRAFMITMRASNPRALSAVVNDYSLNQFVVTSSFYGRTYQETWNKAFTQLLDSSGHPTSGPPPAPVLPNMLVNRGNFEADTMIRLYGPLTNPKVHNLTAGTNLIINGSISSGDYYQIDSQKGTVLDSYGNSQYSKLDHASDSMKMLRGANLWSSSADGVDPSSTKVRIIWRDSWV